MKPIIDRESSINDLIRASNSDRFYFTPGPPSLSAENVIGLSSSFGRGDLRYLELEDHVLSRLRQFTNHSKIVRLQGSASLALEILALNFLSGLVVIVNTGYYSKRLEFLTKSAMRAYGYITKVICVDWSELASTNLKADWIWACPTETSVGLRVNIHDLHEFAVRSRARLALDATASIGLEGGHELSDVLAYSSCKGLFGLTGAAFIAFNESPSNSIDSFNLSLQSHIDKTMTGPYNAIQSLHNVLDNHSEMLGAVKTNKAKFIRDMSDHLVWDSSNEPLLCTMVSVRLRSRTGKAVLYEPRTPSSGAVVSHLGEVHLGSDATGEILRDLEVIN